MWTSLYETNPYGVLDDQPNYINTLLLIKSNVFPKPSYKKAKYLLIKFKELENDYGRVLTAKKNLWESRCLDLDIIWWENLYVIDDFLTLPHPRFMNRNFVITPLAELLGKDQKVEKLSNKKWVT